MAAQSAFHLHPHICRSPSTFVMLEQINPMARGEIPLVIFLKGAVCGTKQKNSKNFASLSVHWLANKDNHRKQRKEVA